MVSGAGVCSAAYHGSPRVQVVEVKQETSPDRGGNVSPSLLSGSSVTPPLSERHAAARTPDTGLCEAALQSPGGFGFNGVSRGSAPAVCFINASPPPARLPAGLLAVPAIVMDGTAVCSCLLRKLFLAAGMGVNTRSFPPFRARTLSLFRSDVLTK